MQLTLKDVSYIYGIGTSYEKTALNNINLTINEAEFVSIIGHTGSGKSTLIQHLNGLLKPTKGKILINNIDIHANKENLKGIRQKVGLVFQYPEHQLFETTVFEDVAFGPKNMGISEGEIKERVEEALEIVGIKKDDFQKSPFELSGGQKRRVAIAGVLAMKPQILVLDEPTAGLDPKGRDEILQNIKLMHEKLKISIVLVSHSMEDVSKLAEKIYVISKGEIVLEGNVKEVFKEVDLLESIGLAAPQISYLIKSLNEKGYNFPSDIYTIEEATEVLYRHLKNREGAK